MSSSFMGSHDLEAGASEPETPSHSADARPRGQSPVLSESRHAGENGSLFRNVCSTGSGPNPSFMVSAELGGGTSIRYK
jgi:hypothetical protein